MAQWAHLGRARVPFHLYVPAGCIDIARRLAAENQVNIAELWSFHTIGDQTRFTLVHRAPTPEPKAATPRPATRSAKPAAKRTATASPTKRGSGSKPKPAARKTSTRRK
jgi:hypothetical protein